MMICPSPKTRSRSNIAYSESNNCGKLKSETSVHENTLAVAEALDTDYYNWEILHQQKDCFVQPAVSHIDDAIRRRADMKPNAKMGRACKKWGP
jgi:hypothetical protein